MKRVLILSDLHCGSVVGLTPPAWQFPLRHADGERIVGTRLKQARLQRACWDWFQHNVKQRGPYDVVFCNGDAIEGKGTRSGSSELVTADREEQCRMATYALQSININIGATPPVIMTHGTPYHTGAGEDWERWIADDLKAKIGSHEWVDVEGVVFDLKHAVGGSSIPHGRSTAVHKEKLWNTLWAQREQQPNANVVVRSHVHYHAYCGTPEYLALTTPALQGHGTKYGARKCSGTIDYGFVVFECDRKAYKWEAVIGRLPELKAKATVV